MDARELGQLAAIIVYQARCPEHPLSGWHSDLVHRAHTAHVPLLHDVGGGVRLTEEAMTFVAQWAAFYSAAPYNAIESSWHRVAAFTAERRTPWWNQAAERRHRSTPRPTTVYASVSTRER
jgi:hypothetical protein